MAKRFGVQVYGYDLSVNMINIANDLRMEQKAQYIDQNSNLLAPVVCFSELVQNGLWSVLSKSTCTVTVWPEQI